MKNQIWAAALLLLTATVVCSAEPPPNDDFTNRIVLNGNDIAFAGTLAGATIESDGSGSELLSLYTVPGTVWWSWTATQTLPVILESLDAASDSCEYITVWPTPDPQLGFPVITNYSSGGIQRVGSLLMPENVPRTYIIFPATNGATYNLQFGGVRLDAWKTPTNLFRFRLTASSARLIKQQPSNLTVSSNGSALFTIAAAGSPPLAYQWQFNGENIPGAHGAILGLTNVMPAQAGGYCVVVSNTGGAVTSITANLWISLANKGPVLSVLGPSAFGSFDFALSGDTGRSYRIESSTDLVHWLADPNFDSGSIYLRSSGPILTSVIFNNNSVSSLRVSKTSKEKFFRATPYAPPNEICNMNLKLIRFGKDLWAGATTRLPSDSPLDVDLYGPNGILSYSKPRCPLGGVYSANLVGQLPACSFPGHVLEEPR